MPIVMNHSAPVGSYGGVLANAEKQTAYMNALNPFIQQYMGQEFQSGESGKQRTWQTGESALDRALQQAMQQSQQAFQGQESELERALREKLSLQQYGVGVPKSFSYSFKPAYSGPGTYGYGAQQIHQKHFGY